MQFHKGYWWLNRCREEDFEFHLKRYEEWQLCLPLCDESKVCVQDGGNIGIWPKQLASYFEKVYTFEPEGECYEVLAKNCEELDNVIHKNVALGDSERVVNFKPSNMACHHISEDGSEEIRIITIDSLCLENCDCIILDVEGYEYYALKGAIETIKAFKPVIQLETGTLSNRYGINSQEIEELLYGFGYEEFAKIRSDRIYVCLKK